MADRRARTTRAAGEERRGRGAAVEPCLVVIFGASGDLTKRLLIPALYNLACAGLWPERCAILGTAMDELTAEQFRARMSEDIKKFSTRKEFDQAVWDGFVSRLYYAPGRFDDPASYGRLSALLEKLDGEHQTQGNALFYLATPPEAFSTIAAQLGKAGLATAERGWRRLIVEKPFGRDLASAAKLNGELLAHWKEEQIYRIDHYLGKETVQNLLAFRFSNGLFEPLWNREHIDHIQFTVAETVGVEARGRYYERAGALRDMVQNHMLQMLAYLCMEPPSSFAADAVRNEKAKVLDALRVLKPSQVRAHAVRGQYGPGRKPEGSPAAGYRQEKDVSPDSGTETFAALKVHVDNWRWEGVPIYLRSGKSLWKRGTEIVVQFKKAPEVVFRHSPEVRHLDANQLIFHIQPDQGIEFRFHAKSPGPTMCLQKVSMRFDYAESFEASPGTGYEVLVYNCMMGDATLFSRCDLVESAWKFAQPILDAWAAAPAGREFPDYEAGTWGPKAAFDLIERDGRKWVDVISRAVLEQVPLFKGANPVFQHALALMLKPVVFAEGDIIVKKGDVGQEMYFVARGAVDVFDGKGKPLGTLAEGAFFGERALLTSEPRAATVRAKTQADLYVLEKADLLKALKDHPELARAMIDISRRCYDLALDPKKAFSPQIARLIAYD